MTRLIITVLVVSGLGCSNTPSPKEANIGWHCEETPRSIATVGATTGDGVNCKQGRIANGAVIADVTAPEKKPDKPAATRESATLPVSEKPLEVIVIGDKRPKPWRQQLPGFKVDEPVSAGNGKTLVRPERPAPVPEAAFPDELIQSSQASTRPRVATETPPQAKIIETADKQGVTVQLGAFQSEAAAQKFLRDNNLFHLEIVTQAHEKAGTRWHVLTFGQFPDKQTADKAWQIATENAAEIDVWIRPILR